MSRRREASGEAAVSNGAVDTADRPWLFGGARGADPREAGRIGGIQSGRSRRGELETDRLAKVLMRHGGSQSLYGLYRYAAKREAALEAERRQADATLTRIKEWCADERAELAHLTRRRREYEAAVNARMEALEQREAELKAKAESADGLVAVLADVPEPMLEAALVKLGHLVEEVADDAEAAHEA